MLKLILTGAWVCIVTLAAVYVSVSIATAPPADPQAAKKNAFELVKGEAITIPSIAGGKVNGYFLGRVSFMMDKEKIKGLELPLTEYMTDEMFTLLVGSKMIDIVNPVGFNLDEFRRRIKDDMNKRLGGEFVGDVMVEQLDYLPKDDTRAGSGGAGKFDANATVKIVGDASSQAPAKQGH